MSPSEFGLAPGTAPPQRIGGTPRSQLTPQQQDVPDDPIKLPEGWLACRTCGIAVQRTADLGEEIHLESLGRAAEGPAAMTEAASNQRPIPLTFALCPDHQRTAELADQLVPDAGQQLGRALSWVLIG